MFLSIYFPTLLADCDLQQHYNGHAISLLYTQTYRGKSLVVRCSACARDAGVRLGMELAVAQSIVPHALCFSFDPVREEKLLTHIALSCSIFSPFIALDYIVHNTLPSKMQGIQKDPRANGIVIEISGSERLFGGYDLLLQTVQHFFSIQGVHVCLAMAQTQGLAWALSRYVNTPLNALEKKNMEILKGLPLAALRLSCKTIERCAELYITTCDELLLLPRSVLATRLPRHDLRRIEEVLGEREEITSYISLPQRKAVRQEFLGPVTDHLVLRTQSEKLLERVFTTLCSTILSEELGSTIAQEVFQIATLTLVLETLSDCYTVKESTREAIHFARPTRNKRLAQTLIRNVFERQNIHRGVCAIEIELTKLAVSPPPVQSDLFISCNPDSTEEYSLDEVRATLFDTLSMRLADASLCVLSLREAFLPENSYDFMPFSQDKNVRNASLGHAFLRSSRPAVQLINPLQIEVIRVVKECAARIMVIRKNKYIIQQSYGPEYITAPWWSGGDERREYYSLQLTTGLWVWVFRRVQSDTWFLHGLYT